MHCLPAEGAKNTVQRQHQFRAPESLQVQSRVCSRLPQPLRQACELLLEYCLMDLDLGRKEDVAKLANLPLVAMADGVFETLKLSKEADKELYVMSPREADLLSNQSQRIVSWHVSLSPLVEKSDLANKCQQPPPLGTEPCENPLLCCSLCTGKSMNMNGDDRSQVDSLP